MQNETVKGGLRGNALILATAQKMWAQNGLFSFYRGLSMGLVGMFPYAAIDLGTFEYLKRRLTVRKARIQGGHQEDVAPGNFTLAIMGGFSGAFGASAVYPINLLRTRLQSQGTASHPRTYTGIVDVTRQTLKGEGVRGLFKGLTPNLLKVIPAVSIVSITSLHLLTFTDRHSDLCCVREYEKGVAPNMMPAPCINKDTHYSICIRPMNRFSLSSSSGHCDWSYTWTIWIRWELQRRLLCCFKKCTRPGSIAEQGSYVTGRPCLMDDVTFKSQRTVHRSSTS